MTRGEWRSISARDRRRLVICSGAKRKRLKLVQRKEKQNLVFLAGVEASSSERKTLRYPLTSPRNLCMKTANILVGNHPAATSSEK